ncbi:Ccm protein [Enterobacteriaceae bacterium RIT693]|nr:Ccm protein [Enterobacteriaceae bacterium RIT693]
MNTWSGMESLMNRDVDERSHIFLNSGIIFWILTLIAWYCHYDVVSVVLFLLMLLFFTLHILNIRIIKMFRKLRVGGAGVNIPESADLLLPTVKENTVVAESNPPGQEDKPANTVIASGVRFEGDINTGGMVYVYGTITGNIESREGIVKVMRNGLVEGNIRSRELIVDGQIKGTCQAESIDVCENGSIDGTLSYVSLAVKKGGVFIGQASLLNTPQQTANIVDLKNDNTAQGVKSGKDKKMTN